MKTKSRSLSDNRRYVIGTKLTPIGPAGVVVWDSEIVGIEYRGRNIVGVKLYKSETIWCSADDDGVKRLIRDRERNGGRT